MSKCGGYAVETVSKENANAEWRARHDGGAKNTTSRQIRTPSLVEAKVKGVDGLHMP